MIFSSHSYIIFKSVFRVVILLFSQIMILYYSPFPHLLSIWHLLNVNFNNIEPNQMWDLDGRSTGLSNLCPYLAYHKTDLNRFRGMLICLVVLWFRLKIQLWETRIHQQLLPHEILQKEPKIRVCREKDKLSRPGYNQFKWLFVQWSAFTAVALGLVSLTVLSTSHSKDPKCFDPNTCHRKNRWLTTQRSWFSTGCLWLKLFMEWRCCGD